MLADADSVDGFSRRRTVIGTQSPTLVVATCSESATPTFGVLFRGRVHPRVSVQANGQDLFCEN
jgi:hypothetical protein